jgi:hypothetical protein
LLLYHLRVYLDVLHCPSFAILSVSIVTIRMIWYNLIVEVRFTSNRIWEHLFEAPVC